VDIRYKTEFNSGKEKVQNGVQFWAGKGASFFSTKLGSNFGGYTASHTINSIVGSFPWERSGQSRQCPLLTVFMELTHNPIRLFVFYTMERPKLSCSIVTKKGCVLAKATTVHNVPTTTMKLQETGTTI
jgi:hypothetical protein